MEQRRGFTMVGLLLGVGLVSPLLLLLFFSYRLVINGRRMSGKRIIWPGSLRGML